MPCCCVSKDKSLFCAVLDFYREPLFAHSIYLVYDEQILIQQTACNTKSTAHTLETCRNNNNFGIKAKKFAVTLGNIMTLCSLLHCKIVGLHGCLESTIILCCIMFSTCVS